MANGIYTAVSGAIARQQQLDTVSHNLANVDTPGYRAITTTFEEVLASQDPSIRQVAVGDMQLDMAEGVMDETGNPLDLAVSGNGFFMVGTPGGPLLTRDGQFHVDGQGQLVARDGAPVLNGEGQPILVPSDSANIEVDEMGNIYDDYGLIDQLGLMTAPHGAMKPAGPARFKVNPRSMTPAEGTMVQQGVLEKSNVNPVEGMTDLIALHRHFETMQKLISTYRSIDQRAATSIGRVE